MNTSFLLLLCCFISAAYCIKPSGIHFDIELHSSQLWKNAVTDEEKSLLLNGYVDLILKMQDELKDTALQLSFDCTFSYQNDIVKREGKDWTLMKWIIHLSNSTTLMAYRDSAEKIISLATVWLDTAKDLGKTVVIGVEFNENEATRITFYDEGEEYMEKELAKVHAHFLSHPGYGGLAIHAYSGLLASHTTPPSVNASSPARDLWVWHVDYKEKVVVDPTAQDTLFNLTALYPMRTLYLAETGFHSPTAPNSRTAVMNAFVQRAYQQEMCVEFLVNTRGSTDWPHPDNHTIALSLLTAAKLHALSNDGDYCVSARSNPPSSSSSPSPAIGSSGSGGSGDPRFSAATPMLAPALSLPLSLWLFCALGRMFQTVSNHFFPN